MWLTLPGPHGVRAILVLLCAACIEMVVANSSYNCEPRNDCKLVASHLYFHALHTSSQGLVACAVQCFYAWRVKVVTEKIWMVVIIVAMAVISMRKLFSL